MIARTRDELCTLAAGLRDVAGFSDGAPLLVLLIQPSPLTETLWGLAPEVPPKRPGEGTRGAAPPNGHGGRPMPNASRRTAMFPNAPPIGPASAASARKGRTTTTPGAAWAEARSPSTVTRARQLDGAPLQLARGVVSPLDPAALGRHGRDHGEDPKGRSERARDRVLRGERRRGLGEHGERRRVLGEHRERRRRAHFSLRIVNPNRRPSPPGIGADRTIDVVAR